MTEETTHVALRAESIEHALVRYQHWFCPECEYSWKRSVGVIPNECPKCGVLHEDALREKVDHVSKMKVLYLETQKFFMLANAALDEMMIDLQKGKVDCEPGIIDIGFLCRESSKMMDDLRKEFNAKHDLCGKLICMEAMRTGHEGSMKGTLANATPKPSQEVILPKKGTSEYLALMEFMGISPEMAELGMLSISYLRFAKFVTDCTEQERPLPPGCGDISPKFISVFRKIRVRK